MPQKESDTGPIPLSHMFRCAGWHKARQGLQYVLVAAELKQDDIFQQTLSLREDILNLQYKVPHHKSCRARYTSKTNLIHTIVTSPPSVPTDSCEYQPRLLSRADTSSFNIREQCFICGFAEKRLPNKSREKLTSISTDMGQSTRSKVIESAKKRIDEVVHLRMLSYPDLFAFDAKYHRSCYSHYISNRNIQAVKRQTELNLASSVHDKAFCQLTKELERTILCKHTRPVTTLTTQCARFIEILIEMGVPKTEADCYSTWKLKHRLKAHFRDRLSFIERSGYSDLLCSSAITVGDALRKAADLQMTLTAQSQPDLEDFSDTTGIPVHIDETLILHRAAGIPRNKMSSVKESPDEYLSTAELAIGHCRDFVPDILYDFIFWIASEIDFENVSSSSERIASDKDIRVLAICHNIIALCLSLRTPLTLGLGIHVHHDVGSKKLIDVLHSLGYSVSYDEVRRFVTSVAKDQLSQSEDVYIPRGIQNVVDGATRTHVDAAIDNFDQNEETLDGKTTTHAMAIVLYQRCKIPHDDGQIPRTMQKALDVTEYSEQQLKRYEKPHKRPEPPIVSDVSCLDTKEENTSKARSKDLIWELARFTDDNDEQTVPAWSGFNAMTSGNSTPVANVKYLPFISAPPSDISTVYTTLLKLVATSRKLGQNHILVTANMAIYRKAQEILWTKPELLAQHVTMRLGGMHFLMAFIASIGKLFGDGGLLQLLTVTGIYADATVHQMVQGKQLNRAVRGIKLVTEALTSLYFQSAQSWSEKEGLPWVDDNTAQGLKDLQHTFRGHDSQSSIEIIDSLAISNVKEFLTQFRSAGRSQSATFTFWDNFIEAAHIMLMLLRAEREANFMLHLDAVCEAISYFLLQGGTIMPNTHRYMYLK